MADITREHLDKHVHGRLRLRVRLYLGIAAAIVIAIIYRVAAHGGGILYPLVALIVGILAGVFLSRMFALSWDEKAAQVVARIDAYGAVLLVVYIIFELSGEQLIRQWFAGAEVLTIILSLAGGAVLGRGLGMARNMVRVLRSNV